MNLQHIFMQGVKNATDAVQFALKFEKDSVIFHLSMLDATCEGKARDVVSIPH